MIKFFYQRLLREKMLLTLFMWVLFLIWLFYFYNNCLALKDRLNTAWEGLDYQELWLSNQIAVQERLDKSLEQLDPEKSYAKNEFIGRVDAIARDSGGQYDISNPTTEKGDIFQEHLLSVNFRNTLFSNLLKFEEAIEKEAPYLGLRKIQMSPNLRNPNLIEARFEIVSIELIKSEPSSTLDK